MTRPGVVVDGEVRFAGGEAHFSAVCDPAVWPAIEMTPEGERIARVLGMCLGVWAIDMNNVRVLDLVHARPGGIVRVNGNPHECIRFIPAMGDEAIGCLAASDEE